MYPNRKFNRQAGFSMMELLISMVTMTIITGAAFALIGGSIKFTSATYHMTDAEQTLRTAHEIINRDLTTAGDGLRGIGTITAPLAFVQTYLTRSPVTCNDPNYPCIGLVTSDDGIPAGTAVPQASPAANFLVNSDRISMLIRDSSFNNGNAVSLLAGQITVAGSNTNLAVGSSNIGLFQVGEIYAVLSQSGAAFGMVSGLNTATNTVVMANGDVYGLNQTVPLAPISAVAGVVSGVSLQGVSIVRLRMIQYFVSVNGSSTNGLLVRRVFGVRGAGFVDSVVAEHVTNLQFRYLTNLSDPNGFVRQPARVLSSSLEQTGVREIETTIAVETVRAVNTVTNSNNGRQSVQTTTATTVRNLQFRQAL